MTSFTAGTAPPSSATRRHDTQPTHRPAGRRRMVELAVLAVEETAPEPPRPAPVVVPRPRVPARPTTLDYWLRLAERAVGDWAATLRAALVLTLLFVAAVVAIGIVFGPIPAAAATAVGATIFLIGRSRGDSPD